MEHKKISTAQSTTTELTDALQDRLNRVDADLTALRILNEVVTDLADCGISCELSPLYQSVTLTVRLNEPLPTRPVSAPPPVAKIAAVDMAVPLEMLFGNLTTGKVAPEPAITMDAAPEVVDFGPVEFGGFEAGDAIAVPEGEPAPETYDEDQPEEQRSGPYSDEEIDQIWQWIEDDVPVAEMAKKLNRDPRSVGPKVAGLINKATTDIEGDEHGKKAAPRKLNTKPMTIREAKQLEADFKAGKTPAEIAEAMNRPFAEISRICARITVIDKKNAGTEIAAETPQAEPEAKPAPVMQTERAAPSRPFHPTGTDWSTKELRQHYMQVPSGDFTIHDDLAIATALSRGDGAGGAAMTIGRTKDEVVARWRSIMPSSTVANQAALLSILREMAEHADQ